MASQETDMVCRRCGQCCRLGGPALHRSDRPLLARGVLSLGDLVTLRRGAGATDNVTGAVGPSPEELVKIAPGPDGRTCRFFTTPAACAIHSDRPLECRLLFCDAPQALAAAYRTDRLTRADILDPDSPLAALCAAHEAETDLVRLAALCRAGLAGDRAARTEALRQVRFDAAFRELLPARAGVPPETVPFYLGPPPDRVVAACRALCRADALYITRPSA